MASTVNDDDHHYVEVKASAADYRPYVSPSTVRKPHVARKIKPLRPREVAKPVCRYSDLISGHVSPADVRTEVGLY